VDLVNQLDNLSNEEAQLKHGWLQTYYSALNDRFLADIDRIWSTGAIMIPLSLGAAVALVTIDERTISDAVFLAVPSIMLIVFWNLIVRRNKYFQDRSMKAMELIEAAVSEKAGIEVRKGEPEGWWFAIHNLRRIFVRGIIAFWVLTLLTYCQPVANRLDAVSDLLTGTTNSITEESYE
jgi:hypothetical protein